MASLIDAEMANRLIRNMKGGVKVDEPMRHHTSFKIGGPADVLVRPFDVDDLKYILSFANEERLPVCVIGNGTNILVADEGIRGIVIEMAGTFDKFSFSDNCVTAGIGVNLPHLVRECATRGLSGLEFASGIPGTLGGAIAMNAGAYGGTIGDIVDEVRSLTYDGVEVIKNKIDMHFGHRESRLQDGDLVAVEARLKLVPGDVEKITATLDEYLKSRKAKQPLNLPSAGCAFKNPSGMGAGRYIDLAGLKGLKVGGAEVSTTHANFIVNTDGATARDVLMLMNIVQNTVFEKYGVTLVPEVKVIGG